MLALGTIAMVLLTRRHVDCAKALQLAYSGQYFAQVVEDPAAALRQYDSALALCPGHETAYRWRYNAAVCAGQTHQLRRAVDELMALIRDVPGYDMAYVPLLQFYAAGNGVSGFRKDGAGGVVLSPEVRVRLEQDLRGALAAGDRATAEVLARLVLRFAPDDEVTRRLLGGRAVAPPGR